MAPMMQLQGDILRCSADLSKTSSIFETASEAAKEANLPVVYSEILVLKQILQWNNVKPIKALLLTKKPFAPVSILVTQKGHCTTTTWVTCTEGKTIEARLKQVSEVEVSSSVTTNHC